MTSQEILLNVILYGVIAFGICFSLLFGIVICSRISYAKTEIAKRGMGTSWKEDFGMSLAVSAIAAAMMVVGHAGTMGIQPLIEEYLSPTPHAIVELNLDAPLPGEPGSEENPMPPDPWQYRRSHVMALTQLNLPVNFELRGGPHAGLKMHEKFPISKSMKMKDCEQLLRTILPNINSYKLTEIISHGHGIKAIYKYDSEKSD